MLEIWEEHACGLNGGPALRDLEKKCGPKWRNNKIGGAGRVHWHRRLCIYKEIEKRMKTMSEADAVNSLGNELKQFPTKGKSKKPNITEFNNQLKKNFK